MSTTDDASHPWRIDSNVIASQVEIHREWGGVVPEIASRQHVRDICGVTERALADAGTSWAGIDAIAVTQGPGLVGSLLVGVAYAKAAAATLSKRLIAVHHLAGHIESIFLEHGNVPLPCLVLVVSGGHTFLVEMRDHLTYRLLGETVDDAAGEAFDKVGRLLGLPYPGGPSIQRAAETATRHDAAFPRAWLGDSYDFSFSGLKTAARRTVDAARAEEGLRPDDPDGRLSDDATAELAWGFQDSVVDVLTTKTVRAAEAVGARSIVLGGGVAANGPLRNRLAAAATGLGVPLVVPRPGLCTDNGAMIGAAAARRLAAGDLAGLDLDARPSLPLARAEPAVTAPAEAAAT